MAGKRLRLDSKFQLKKCNKRSKGDNDWISQLSDDILITILSFLPMKEAARTSILSPRWINLWKHTSFLDFRADSALAQIALECELSSEERLKFVKRVNRILRSHKAVSLQEFTVCFGLGRSYGKSITRWLEFAFTRHVQKLELDFSAKYKYRGYPPKHYTLPEEFLTGSTGDFKSLKELSFKCVNLTGEDIETLLRICPLLEKLVVHGTNKISNLEVCGPSLVLKHLQLDFCNHLKSVKVSAPNLISLIGPIVEVLLLENVPMLKEVSVNMCNCDSVAELLPTLSCCIYQLEILTLQLFAWLKEMDLSMFPQLPKLKKLVIVYSTEGDKSLMGLATLITACPNLQEFVLSLSVWKRSRSHREVMTTGELPHHHLKVFKVCGYYGRSSDVEIVRHVLENSVALEKLIIDPSFPVLSGFRLLPTKLEEVQTARDYAKQQLEALVPQHVELVIL